MHCWYFKLIFLLCIKNTLATSRLWDEFWWNIIPNKLYKNMTVYWFSRVQRSYLPHTSFMMIRAELCMCPKVIKLPIHGSVSLTSRVWRIFLSWTKYLIRGEGCCIFLWNPVQNHNISPHYPISFKLLTHDCQKVKCN